MNYYLKLATINKDFYFWFKQNNRTLGKCIFNLNNDTIFIKHVEILKNYRGSGLFPIFWKLMEEGFKEINIVEISLNAEEDQTKYNKLLNIYLDLGLNIDKTKRIRETYNGDILLRIVPMIKYIN